MNFGAVISMSFRIFQIFCLSILFFLAGCGGASYPLGGNASGLEPGDQVIIQNTQAEKLVIQGNGSFRFVKLQKADSIYSITIAQKPDYLDCRVANGERTMSRSEVSDVYLICMRSGYQLEGKIFGVTGHTEIQFNNGEVLSFSGDEKFTTNRYFPLGKEYHVKIAHQPEDQTCAILNHRDDVTQSTKASIRIFCQPFSVETPKIYSVHPQKAWPGSLVKVTGSGFDRASITLNDETVSAIYQDDSEIQIKMPDRGEGEFDVTVVNAKGQDTAAITIPKVIKGLQVARSLNHACLLTRNRTVECWGNGALLGQAGYFGSDVPVLVEGLPPIRKIEAGDNHTCALSMEGDVWCWGLNQSNILGKFPRKDEYGNPIQRNPGTPVKIPDLPRARELVSGHATACILAENRLVYCWGNNLYGQLGNMYGAINSPETYVPVDNVYAAVALSGNGQTFCVVESNETARCWGYNARGQIGDGTTDDAYAAKGISVSSVIDVASARNLGCALTRYGQVYCWGNAGSGERNVHLIQDVTDVKDIEATDNGLVCARQQESVTCWDGIYGFDRMQHRFSGSDMFATDSVICSVNENSVIECIQEYFDSDSPNYDSPVRSEAPVSVTGLRARDIAVSEGVSCAVLVNGEVACWGSNAHYQLGNGSVISARYPVIVDGVENARSLFVEWQKACAVTNENGLVCWDELVEMAGGTRGRAFTLAGQNDIVSLSGGTHSQCAIRQDHSVWCGGGSPVWEYGLSTHLPSLGPARHADPTASGADGVCAQTLDNKVVCGTKWGAPSSNFPAGYKMLDWLSEVDAITVGAWHACALSAEQFVRCWLVDTESQFELDAPKMTQIHANWNRTSAIDAEGHVYSWEIIDYTTGARMSSPMRLPGFQDAVSVRHFADQTCMINSKGAVSCSHYQDATLPAVFE